MKWWPFRRKATNHSGPVERPVVASTTLALGMLAHPELRSALAGTDPAIAHAAAQLRRALMLRDMHRITRELNARAHRAATQVQADVRARPCSECGGPMPVGVIHYCDAGKVIR